MREKFEEILKEHNIYGEDLEEILYAVHDMLLLIADETKEKEPYAIHTINRLEMAAHEVFELVSDLDE